MDVIILQGFKVFELDSRCCLYNIIRCGLVVLQTVD